MTAYIPSSSYCSSPKTVLNWNEIWKEERRCKSGLSGTSRNWNARASDFSQSTRKSTYARNFLKACHFSPDTTILDIGCGPGTLALPLAKHTAHITAMDISEKMIAIVDEECQRRHITNITTKKAGWLDDWQKKGIEEHDVVIASRSLVVDDLQEAILKMQAMARREIYISSLVGDGPYDRRIFEAMGRKLNRGPDFLCVYNLLNQMGILANISFLHSNRQPRLYRDIDDAIASFFWMTGPLQAHEETLLRAYFIKHLQRHRQGWSLDYQHRTCWALISWKK